MALVFIWGGADYDDRRHLLAEAAVGATGRHDLVGHPVAGRFNEDKSHDRFNRAPVARC